MKKSFIIHIDTLSILKKLSDEQAGKLFKAISAYHHDEDVELDALTDIIFDPFRNQFNRDSEKYESFVQSQREKGVKSAESRAKNKSTEVNHGQPRSTTVESGQPKSTESTNSVSDSDRVSGSKNKNDNKKPSPDKSEGLTNPFLESYNAFLKKRTGTTEQFSVAGRTALKKIITYLKSQVSIKNAGAAPEFLDAETLKAWQWLLNHFEKWDKFHQGQLKLEQINSNLVNIISSIRNGNTTKSGTKQAVDYNRVGAEALTIVAASYGLTGTPNQHTTQGEQTSDGGEGDFTDFQIVQ